MLGPRWIMGSFRCLIGMRIITDLIDGYGGFDSISMANVVSLRAMNVTNANCEHSNCSCATHNQINLTPH